jgi:hypothetical protein
MKFDNLTDSNFLLYAAKHYDNPQCFSMDEFHQDLLTFKYIKRLFKRYKDYDILKEKLILNHIILVSNVFGPEATARMLFLKFGEYDTMLKPFLEYLGMLPEVVYQVRGKNIKTNEIISDPVIEANLSQI